MSVCLSRVGGYGGGPGGLGGGPGGSGGGPLWSQRWVQGGPEGGYEGGSGSGTKAEGSRRPLEAERRERSNTSLGGMS